jgi:diguanylate cyclase (GGDEF)-like protein
VKILIAEDDKISRKILCKIFSEQDEISAAVDGSQAWNILEQPDHPRLLILDWLMPGKSGVEIVNRLRQRDNGHEYYVIILTSMDTNENTIYALEQGADDFVTKPFDTGTLRARVNVGRRVVTLHETLNEKMRQLTLANATISRLASTDELTGLYNRRFFNDALGKTLSVVQRHQIKAALIMADLDHFKRVNDEHGHDRGDLVLKIFSDTLRTTVRQEDIAARWGGEEFILLLPLTPLAGALTLAERLRQIFARNCPAQSSLAVTASFGVTDIVPGENSTSVLQRVDQALYCAKHAGRNRVASVQQETS